MSEYLEFYVKANNDKDNNFISIATFCRSNQVFQFFKNGAPAYTTLKRMPDYVAASVRQDVRDTIKRYKSYIKEEKKNIKAVEGKYPLDEFIEYKNERELSIKEFKEDIKDMKYVEYFTIFLEDIDGEIWYGIECELPEGKKV